MFGWRHCLLPVATLVLQVNALDQTGPMKFHPQSDLQFTFENTYLPTKGPSSVATLKPKNPQVVQNTYDDGTSRWCLQINSNQNQVNTEFELDNAFFNVGTSDYTIQMDMKRTTDEGNGYSFKLQSCNGGDTYFRNDRFHLDGYTGSSLVDLDWSKWHTIAIGKSPIVGQSMNRSVHLALIASQTGI